MITHKNPKSIGYETHQSATTLKPQDDFIPIKSRSFHYESPKFEQTGGKIRALKSFGSVLKGDLGGSVDTQSLSQRGNCWVYQNAQVANSKIINGAQITGNSKVQSSIVGDEAVVCDSKVNRSTVFYKTYIKDSQTNNCRVDNSTILNSDLNNCHIKNAELNHCYAVNSHIENINTDKALYLNGAYIEDHRDIQRAGAIAGKEFVVYYRGPNNEPGCSYTNEPNTAGPEITNKGFVLASSVKELISNFDFGSTAQQNGFTHQKDRRDEYFKMIDDALFKLNNWRLDNPFKSRSIDLYYGFDESNRHNMDELFTRPTPKSY